MEKILCSRRRTTGWRSSSSSSSSASEPSSLELARLPILNLDHHDLLDLTSSSLSFASQFSRRTLLLLGKSLQASLLGRQSLARLEVADFGEVGALYVVGAEEQLVFCRTIPFSTSAALRSTIILSDQARIDDS